MSKVKHATIKGLTGKEVDSVLEKAQSLLASNTDNMDGTERYLWKEAAYTLLTERGNNWINVDFSCEPFKTELTRLVEQCEETILTRTVAKENQEAAASSHLIFNLLKQQGEKEMIINKEVAASKEEVVTPVQEEEKEMTVSELTNVLIVQGVDPELAYQTALKVAKEKAQESQPLEIEQKVSNVKPWFQKAVENLIVPRKTSLVGQLTIIELACKEETEKAEINAEIDRLLDKEKGDARFNQLLEGYILETKGWELDKTTGKVSGIIYSTGDITEKGVSMTVKGLGAATAWTGEKIAKAGTAMQNNAPKVGAAARKPWDVTANLISGINKKK